MLWNLLDGRAYTATELATSANISLQSASGHLKKMTSMNILTVEKQGRHRYFKFANDQVAQVVESMASLIPLTSEYQKIKPPQLTNFTYARTCYDHLAGHLGIQITQALLKQQIIKTFEKEYVVTEYGKKWFQKLGIDIANIKRQKRSFAYQCLDWSERKHHIGGALGASLLEKMTSENWIRKRPHSREVILTSKGKSELKKKLNLEF